MEKSILTFKESADKTLACLEILIDALDDFISSEEEQRKVFDNIPSLTSRRFLNEEGVMNEWLNIIRALYNKRAFAHSIINPHELRLFNGLSFGTNLLGAISISAPMIGPSHTIQIKGLNTNLRLSSYWAELINAAHDKGFPQKRYDELIEEGVAALFAVATFVRRAASGLLSEIKLYSEHPLSAPLSILTLITGGRPPRRPVISGMGFEEMVVNYNRSYPLNIPGQEIGSLRQESIDDKNKLVDIEAFAMGLIKNGIILNCQYMVPFRAEKIFNIERPEYDALSRVSFSTPLPTSFYDKYNTIYYLCSEPYRYVASLYELSTGFKISYLVLSERPFVWDYESDKNVAKTMRTIYKDSLRDDIIGTAEKNIEMCKVYFPCSLILDEDFIAEQLQA